MVFRAKRVGRFGCAGRGESSKFQHFTLREQQATPSIQKSRSNKCSDSPAYFKALPCMVRNYAMQTSFGQDPCFHQQVSAAIEIIDQVKQKQEG